MCEKCRSLVYGGELQQISAHAKSLESEQRYVEARDAWSSALKLLPQTSQQAVWIRDKITELDRTAGGLAEMRPATQAGERSLAESIPKFLVTFALFIAVEAYYGGMKFGIGFSVLILIHELGHFIDVRRRGMTADLPVFLPGLGAFVRFRSGMISREVRAAVSLAGPFAGFLSAAVCAAVWYATGDKYWAVLAQSGAWLNMLNLTPVWISDGGQAAFALDKKQRALLLITALAMWGLTSETVMLIVAGGAAFRLFTKDVPLKPSAAMTAYFVAVVILLAAVMYVAPGTGFVTK